MTRLEIAAQLLAASIAADDKSMDYDGMAQEALARADALIEMDQGKPSLFRQIREQADQYWKGWRTAVLDWEREAEEILQQAGQFAHHIREGGGKENLRASVAITFRSMLRLLTDLNELGMRPRIDGVLPAANFDSLKGQCQNLWHTDVTLVCRLPKGHDDVHREGQFTWGVTGLEKHDG